MPVPVPRNGSNNVHREAHYEFIRDQLVPTGPNVGAEIALAPRGSGLRTTGQPRRVIQRRNEVPEEEDPEEEVSSSLPPLMSATPSPFEEYLDRTRQVDHDYLVTRGMHEDLIRHNHQDDKTTSDSDDEDDLGEKDFPGIDINNVYPRVFCSTGRQPVLIQAGTVWGDLEEGFPPVRPRLLIRDRLGYRKENDTIRLLKQPEWYVVSKDMIRLWPEKQTPDCITEIERRNYDIEIYVERETDCGEESWPWKIQIVHCVGPACYFCNTTAPQGN